MSRKKITGWECKLISKAGKGVLIKLACQTMPIYSMSVFRILVGLCSEIESLFAQYWWSKGTDKGMHRKSWKYLSTRKDDGGLGFS